MMSCYEWVCLKVRINSRRPRSGSGMTEKAHNLKGRTVEVIQIYRGLVDEDASRLSEILANCGSGSDELGSHAEHLGHYLPDRRLVMVVLSAWLGVSRN